MLAISMSHDWIELSPHVYVTRRSRPLQLWTAGVYSKSVNFQVNKRNFQFRAMHKCCPNDVVLSEIGFWRPSSCLLVVLLTLLTFWRPVLTHTGLLEFNIFTKCFFITEQKPIFWFLNLAIKLRSKHNMQKKQYSVL